MTIRQISIVATVVSLIAIVPVQLLRAQSVTGTGTVPIIKTGQGLGLGSPQGNFTAAAHFVNGVPVGVVRVRFPGFAEVTADVTCLVVNGNRVFVGGPVRAGSVIIPEFKYLYLMVEDNGPKVKGGSVDRALPIATIVDSCDSADMLFAFFDFFSVIVSNGDYIIRDTSPSAASRAVSASRSIVNRRLGQSPPRTSTYRPSQQTSF